MCNLIITGVSPPSELVDTGENDHELVIKFEPEHARWTPLCVCCARSGDFWRKVKTVNQMNLSVRPLGLSKHPDYRGVASFQGSSSL